MFKPSIVAVHRTRHSTYFIGLFIVLIFSISPLLHAQVPEPAPDDQAAAPPQQRRPLTIHAFWENDTSPLRFGGNSDRYYTNGMAVAVTHQPAWAEKIAPWMPFADQFGEAETGAGYVLGQQMFTPSNITTTQARPKERPYAGYLYGGVYWQRANETTLDHFQINIGIVGTSSGADDLQEVIHSAFSANDPAGWDHQLADEPTFQTYLRKKWKLRVWNMLLFDQYVEVEALPQVGVALGTVHRYLEGAATLRIGSNLPDDFGPGRLNDLPTATAGGVPETGFSAYLFGRLGGRAVQHNMLIEGNNFHDSLGVDVEPVVGDASVGAWIGYRRESWSLNFSYTYTWQTHEFREQPTPNPYASLNLSLTAWF